MDKDDQMEVVDSPIEAPIKRSRKREAVNAKKASTDNKDDEFDETVPPLVDFMEILNVSPSSTKSEKRCKPDEDKQPEEKMEDNQSDQKVEEAKQSEEKMEESEKPSTASEGPCNSEGTSGKGESSGMLRSSVSDAAGIFLAKTYRKNLVETEEYALNYISQEFHHPVISCFRELNKADISTILGSVCHDIYFLCKTAQ